MATVLFEETLRIPSIGSLAEFRRWALSDEFPECGRIDYVAGQIEVNMSPEDFFTHATPKGEIYRVLANRVAKHQLGEVVVDRTRISSVEADLSAEPDIVFILNESFDSGRVRLVPKATGEEDRYIEVEGAPDLIVEIISDSSVSKDTKRLPRAYFEAGVEEFWLVDARRAKLVFQIYRRGQKKYEPVKADKQGYQRSEVLGRRYLLTRGRNRHGRPRFELLERSLSKGR